MQISQGPPGREGPAYNVLDFADYMSIFVLDSNHYSSVSGGQTGWLESILAARQHRPHLFPVYPSHRSYSGSTSAEIRE